MRRGIAVLGFDKRGVGGSTGDWKTASFGDLAADVVAATDYLRTRSDIDRAQISTAEMPSLQRFVPAYFTTVREWLGKRVRGFETSAPR